MAKEEEKDSLEKAISEADDSCLFGFWGFSRDSRPGYDSELPSPSPEIPPEPVTEGGPSPWKRRRVGKGTPVRTGQPLIKSNSGVVNSISGVNDPTEFWGPPRPFPVGPFPKAKPGDFSGEVGYDCQDYWHVNELVNKDGQSKLKTNFHFAPFDQRSKIARGWTACTAISVVNAHWLHNNRDLIPTRSEFNRLIVRGSLVWQTLCEQEKYIRLFPDRHFDLETILEANIKPLAVRPEKSFVGFFSPEKFEALKEAMSIDQIWDEMSKKTDNAGFEPKIYIVSWNGHFFVLKMDEDAYYIIDSLGLRLYDGCKKAYILKFDDSSVIYGKDIEVEGSVELPKPIFNGKECCREFIKRFLAAPTVEELEEGDKEGMVPPLILCQRLQIEFHYTYLTPALSPSSSADSSALSLCYSEEFSQDLNFILSSIWNFLSIVLTLQW